MWQPAKLRAFVFLAAVVLGPAIAPAALPAGEPGKQDAQPGQAKRRFDGLYVIMCSDGGKCLDAIAADADKNCCVVQGWQFLNTPNQLWRLEPVDESGRAFKVVSVASGKVLDLEAGTAGQDGGAVQLYDYLGLKNQQWELKGRGDNVYVLRNCAAGKVLDLAAGETAKDGAKVQGWEDLGTDNQRWLLRLEGAASAGSQDLPGASAPPDTAVETVLPLSQGQADPEMRIVWTDPNRGPDAKPLRLGDIVRFEYPGAGREIAWSRGAAAGGLEALVLPRPDLVYRVYRAGEPNGVPRFIREVPLADEKQPFWRPRDKNRMPVPLVSSHWSC